MFYINRGITFLTSQSTTADLIVKTGTSFLDTTEIHDVLHQCCRSCPFIASDNGSWRGHCWLSHFFIVVLFLCKKPQNKIKLSNEIESSPFHRKIGSIILKSEWLLFNAFSAIFQLYHGENELIFLMRWWWGPLCTFRKKPVNNVLKDKIWVDLTNSGFSILCN